ncbi:MAG: DNRLRE domain-containing protein [Pirellula sp.]
MTSMYACCYSLLLMHMSCMLFPIVALEQPVTGDETAKKQTTTDEKTLSFQQGVDDYSGTVDTEIWALAPNTILADNPNASSDSDNDGGESQVVIRFDGIFGASEGQVPKGARVVKANLYVSAFDQGSTVHLHRMNVPFSKTATWNSLVDGVSADGLEASRTKDSLTFGKIAANTSTAIFDVTDTVQYWSAGHPNHGWVFINTGGNGWDFYSSEFEDLKQRPRLEIIYAVPAKSGRLTKNSTNNSDGVNDATNQ